MMFKQNTDQRGAPSLKATLQICILHVCYEQSLSLVVLDFRAYSTGVVQQGLCSANSLREGYEG